MTNAKPRTHTNWATARQQVLERDGYRCVKCGEAVKSAEADVHHLLPRSMGGSDDLSNLVTLCDGCHASHHPNLAGGLARRVLERWAVRLARWLDTEGTIVAAAANFGPALRLFGLERFREGQLPIVQAALAGRSVLVVSPTGSGKTLCFQLPAVLRSGVSVVVSPLKALMSEQVSSLLQQKIPATFINSDLSRDEKQIRYGLLGRGAIKLLYAAPERFYVRSEREREQLSRTKPAFLVIDEAHCVDQWGNDFRPEYGQLRQVREQLGSPPVLAFTATAGQDMQRRILESLGVQNAQVFVRGVDRPNIALLRWAAPPEARVQAIADLLRLPLPVGEKTMIFVPSVKVGEALKTDLAALGFDVPLYSSKVGTPWQRQELLKRFTGASQPVVDTIICTAAFGMGLDVRKVRLVIHWQQSASVEDQLQELGRAGRDGLPAVAVIFRHTTPGGPDLNRLRFMAERAVEAAELDYGTAQLSLRRKFQQIDATANLLAKPACFRRALVTYFEGDAPPHRPMLAMRILEWVFATRSRTRRISACCDFCDDKTIRAHGKLAYVADVLGVSARVSPPAALRRHG